MSKITTQKDFLPKEIHSYLFNLIKSAEFPWYQTPPLIDDKVDVQFGHSLYFNHGKASDWFDEFIPIFNQIGISAFNRIKLNLNCRETEKRTVGGYHCDFTIDHKAPKHFTTSIYYFNDTNGETLVKEKGKIKKIPCVANSLVTFPNDYLHTGTTHTDNSFRYILNLNYY